MLFSNLSMVRLRLGHPAGRADDPAGAVISQRLDSRTTVIEVRSALGAFYRERGRLAEALEQHRMALDSRTSWTKAG